MKTKQTPFTIFSRPLRPANEGILKAHTDGHSDAPYPHKLSDSATYQKHKMAGGDLHEIHIKKTNASGDAGTLRLNDEEAKALHAHLDRHFAKQRGAL